MTTSSSRLIQPVGGTLIDLIVPDAARGDVRARANRLPSLQLSERALYDLELLATGGFSPLDRFMIATDDEEIHRQALQYRDQGKEGFLTNFHVRLGYNWRLSELHGRWGGSPRC